MERNVERIEPKQQIAKRLRVAAYARVSRDGDNMLRSFATQVSYYSKKIQANPEWEYVGVYADEALSGCNAERPEFQRLLADCRAGLIDLVLTKAISRFARNTLTTLEVTRELKALGIGVYFEEQCVNTLSAEGEVMLTILASVAQNEAQQTSDNVKWTLKKRAAHGNPIITNLPYGYEKKNGEVVINEEQAAIVRDIFNWYYNGESSPVIAARLNERGIPSPTGINWGVSQVCKVLCQEKYAGDYCFQKTYTENIFSKRTMANRGEVPMYHIEGIMPQIVDREVWAEVQKMLKYKATRAPRPEKPAPFQRMMFCGATGYMYSVRTNEKQKQFVWQAYRREKRGADVVQPSVPDYAVRECVAAALGLDDIDEGIFRERVEKILVTARYEITVIFKDGSQSVQTWIPWADRRGKNG